MKNFIDFFFKRHDKLQTSPFMLTILLGVVIFAIIYFVDFGGDDSTPNSPPASESASSEESFIDKIKGLISFGSDDSGSGEVVRNIPQLNLPYVPEGITEIKEELLEEETTIDTSSFARELEEPDISQVGRRDPMKKITGQANGSSSGSGKGLYKSSDLVDDSVNYFEGISFQDILLDNTTYDKYGDDKFRGTFIVQGSIIPDLEVGDYILELYYIKKITNDSVVIEYDGKEYVLGSQKIIDKAINVPDKNGVPRKK